jgi:hypothetical protein
MLHRDSRIKVNEFVVVHLLHVQLVFDEFLTVATEVKTLGVWVQSSFQDLGSDTQRRESASQPQFRIPSLFPSSPLFLFPSHGGLPSLTLSYPLPLLPPQPTNNTAPNHNPLSELCQQHPFLQTHIDSFLNPKPIPSFSRTDPYDCIQLIHIYLLRIRVERARAKKLHQLFPLHQPRERRVSVLLLPPFHAAEMLPFSTSRTFFLRWYSMHDTRHQRRIAGHLTLTTTTHPTSCFTTSPASSPTSAWRCDNRR